MDFEMNRTVEKTCGVQNKEFYNKIFKADVVKRGDVRP